jgi:hypothetical protein
MLELHAAAPSFVDVFGIELHQNPVARAAQIGRACGIAAMLLHSSAPIVALLREAERGDGKAFAQALATITALPSLTRRRLIATFAATEWARSAAKPPIDRGQQ